MLWKKKIRKKKQKKSQNEKWKRKKKKEKKIWKKEKKNKKKRPTSSVLRIFDSRIVPVFSCERQRVRVRIALKMSSVQSIRVSGSGCEGVDEGCSKGRARARELQWWSSADSR